MPMVAHVLRATGTSVVPHWDDYVQGRSLENNYFNQAYFIGVNYFLEHVFVPIPFYLYQYIQQTVKTYTVA
jgi:hypothetical protein